MTATHARRCSASCSRWPSPAWGLGPILFGEVAFSTLAAGSAGHFELLSLGVAVTLGAITGDHLVFVIGRHDGTRLRESRLIRPAGVEKWDRARDFIQQHGFQAMLDNRLLPSCAP